MEFLLENLSSWVTSAITPEWLAEFAFHAILIFTLFLYSRMEPRRSSISSRDYPQAGVTIISNAYCRCAPRRRRKTIRRRRGWSASRRPLR